MPPPLTPPFSNVWKTSARNFQRLENRCPETSNVWKFPDGYARAGDDALRLHGEGAGVGAGNLRRRADASRRGDIAPAFGVALVGGVRWFPLVVWLVFCHRISRRSSRFTVEAKNGGHAGNP